ncbi:hypothetical protein [uncultured Sphaerochaeta sp.]|uniref:hypothetical protein n=1 Tax=uncultured Sphaerochaeta sp. TaxID=886478 RepID=UPI0029C9D65B|nr:hypothetical protein [uncultured Sphaerochaeta sp.]
MRRTWVLLFSMVVLMFSGCAHDSSEAYYGLFEDEAALIAFEDEGMLFLVILPWSVVINQADGSGNTPSSLLMELGGMEPLVVVEGQGEELSRIRSLLTTLAVNTTDRAREEVDGQAMLEALKAGAPYLRKSGLADTLSTICPGLDPFLLLQRMEQFRVYDLRSVLEEEMVVDWQQLKSHMGLYLEQIKTAR